MVKRAFAILVIFLFVISGLVSASVVTKLYPVGAAFSGENTQIWQVKLTTDSSGEVSYAYPYSIYGKLYSVQVMHNETLAGTQFLNISSEYPFSQSILSYNLTAGNSTQFPRSSTLLYPLAGSMKLEVSNLSGTGANSADVYAIMTLET